MKELLTKDANIQKDIKKELMEEFNISNDMDSNVLCDKIEAKIKDKSATGQVNGATGQVNGATGQVNGGIAFPVGLNINNVVAHFTPIHSTQNPVINFDKDIVKIDYGVHKNGYIIDEAFSYTRNPTLFPLISASEDALTNILKMARPGTRIREIGETAEEIVRSYEYERSPGVFTPLLPIDNVCGHSIERWNIHGGGKLIYNVRNNTPGFIEANEMYAFEVYVSTGSGSAYMNNSHISHYMIENNDVSNPELSELYNKFNSLAFSPQRHLEKCDYDKLDTLYTQGYLKKYPALVELIDNSYVSQTEKTIFVEETSTTIF